MSCFHHQLPLQVGQESFLVPTWSSQVHKFIVFYVYREHFLGIINLLSSLSRIWVIPSLFYCFGACLMLLFHGFVAKQACLVLWLSKPVFLGNHQLTGVSHFYLWSPNGINHLITYFVALPCPSHPHPSLQSLIMGPAPTLLLSSSTFLPSSSHSGSSSASAGQDSPSLGFRSY